MEYCARRLLARIHAYTRQRLRREIEPVSRPGLHAVPAALAARRAGTRREGRFGVLAVIEQLQGFELAAGAWENAVLAARVEGYRREWLDELCLSGQVTWGRLSVRDAPPDPLPRRSGLTPSRATPITLTIRDDLPWLLRAARGEAAPAEPGPGRTRDILDALRGTARCSGPTWPRSAAACPTRSRRRCGTAWPAGWSPRTASGRCGRCCAAAAGPRRCPGAGCGAGSAAGGPAARPGGGPCCPPPPTRPTGTSWPRPIAEQLVARWGVIFRDLAARENLAVPWRDVLWALRRMEARGTIRGGRFVAGFSGEQFAHPDAVDLLRTVRKQPRTGEPVPISAADPLNLTGGRAPRPAHPRHPANTVTYVDGAVADGGHRGRRRPPDRDPSSGSPEGYGRPTHAASRRSWRRPWPCPGASARRLSRRPRRRGPG